MKKCLFCYKQISESQTDFHPACSRKFFGTNIPPVLPYTKEEIGRLAEEVIRAQVAVTGVQPKLSLDILKKSGNEPQRLTIVGLWGRYILKPQTEQFPHLPELEDLTMHLASLAKIATVPHSLIRFASGELAYITRRIDRDPLGNKKAMEDMCQLTERLTEYKYKGSYEQIGKTILKHSANPKLDLINFFEQVIFSFLTGNADMHLKNFSLIKQSENYTLAPAYDMLSTALVMPEDAEELALTLNGKKSKFSRNDFETALSSFGIDEKVISTIFKKFAKTIPIWLDFIDESFLPEEMKSAYKELILRKADRTQVFIRI